MNTTDESIEIPATATAERLGNAIHQWLETNDQLLRQWQERADGRRRLKTLSDRELADIGIDRIDAMQEAAKPFWEA
jgi:uncharacterized protein YjiS (DUF1127 family)